MRSRRWWIAGGVGIVLALIAGIVWATGDGETVVPGAAGRPEPTPVEAAEGAAPEPSGSASAASGPAGEPVAARPASGMTVVLSPFVAGSPVVQLGRVATVIVQVSGIAPIVAVELWDGAGLVDADRDATRDDSTWSVRLTWRPDRAGAAVLVARAVDADGHSAASNPLTMHVVDDPSAPVAVVQYRTTDSDTPTSIADRFGVPVDLLIGVGRDPDEPFAAGEVVGVPQVQLLDDVPPPDTPDPGAAPPSPADGPSPAIAAALAEDGCHATISASFPDAVAPGAAMLLRAATGGASFEPVPVAGEATNGGVEFAGVALSPGTQVFAVEVAAAAGGSRITSPMLVDGSASCGGSWDGPLRIEGGALLGVPDEVERVFFFVASGAAWQRVPADGQTTLTRFGPGFDVTGHMPDLGAASSVEIEVWGWEEGALVDLGRSRFDATPGFDPGARLGRSIRTSLSLIASPDGEEPEVLVVDQWQPEPGVHRFRWSTNVPGTTHGVWQVLTFAPTPNASPMALGVLEQGTVEGAAGTFEIDLATIVNGPTPSARITSLLPAYADLAGPSGAPVITGRPVVPPGGVGFRADVEALQAVAGNAMFPPIENFYIRVVPMVGDQWSGVATNSVLVRTGDPNLSDLIKTIDFDAVNEPIDPKARPYELHATILPPTPPNPGYQNCWEFVGWNQAERNLNFFQADEYAWWDAFNASVGVGTPICPGVCYPTSLGKVIFSGKACGGGGLYIPVISEFLAAGATLWDVLVTGFNAIKGFVVSTVVTLSGCEALASKAFCNTMATLAVNTALAVYGIPPSLPNSEQLKEVAKGELKDAIIGAAQGLGVPCAELGAASNVAGQDQFSCEALLDKAVDEIDKQVSDYFAAAAYQSAGIPFPPGAIVRPAELGQTGAPIITMTLTPTPGAPQLEGLSCSAKITMRSSWTPPSPGVEVGALFAVGSIVANSSVARLPNWASAASGLSSFDQLWAVPKQTYGGYIVTEVVDLPTEGLTFTAAGPSGTASRTYVPSLNYTDPVEGVYMREHLGSASQPSTWTYGYAANLPYHALQLHRGTNFLAEIYSPCAGVYRYTNPLLGFFGPAPVGDFVKVS